MNVTALLFFIPLFLGIGMGCAWAFVALWNFVHHGPSGVPLPNGPKNPGSLPLQATPQPPRTAPFSMAAAAGAILSVGSIPFGLIVFLIVKAIVNPSMESGSQLNGPVAGNIIIFGFVPALVGVALGWKAVGDFRYHRGHLRGGGTAVFAALGIPVLALIVTALANFEDIDRAISPSRRNPEGTIVACIVVLAAIAASIWAVRALWRFVHTGPPGVPPPPRPAHHVQPSLIPAATSVPFEYRSPGQWAGMPLVHIVRGRDPATGKIPVARGVVAIGVRAHGIVAIGVIASGGLAIGSIAFGVFSMGALAVGIFAGGAAAAGVLALGSLSIGFVSAIGGLAIGDIAKGSLAIGRFYTEGASRIQLDSLWRIGNGLILVAIGTWSAMVPGFREIRKTTDAGRPWSPASFRVVIACIAIFALMMVQFCVPNLPTFQPTPPPAPVAKVTYVSSVITPGTHTLAVALDVPFGMLIDFNLVLHDATGWHDLEDASYTVAQKAPPADIIGKPILPLEATWEFKAGDKDFDFTLKSKLMNHTKVRQGGWAIGDGTIQKARGPYAGFRWEPHPHRIAQQTFDPRYRNDIVPFLRGLPPNADGTGAEILLRITVRPMTSEEFAPEYRLFSHAPSATRLKNMTSDYSDFEKHPNYFRGANPPSLEREPKTTTKP